MVEREERRVSGRQDYGALSISTCESVTQRDCTQVDCCQAGMGAEIDCCREWAEPVGERSQEPQPSTDWRWCHWKPVPGSAPGDQ